MKTPVIIFLSFIIYMGGCSTSKNAVRGNKMKIKNATFHDWREAPKSGSDLPEVGSDLTVTVKNWSEGYAPAYVVFRGRKSVSAKVADSAGNEENEIVLHAKIIRSSGVLMETSEPMDISDRLVYTKADGTAGFIEIEEWEEAVDSALEKNK